MSNHRPIGLASVLYRAVDKALVERIQDAEYLHLSPAQFAYTKDIGVEDALLSLQMAILGRAHKTARRIRHISDRAPVPCIVGVIKIDFKDAFSTCSHAGMLADMLQCGVPRQYVIFWHQVAVRRTL